MERFELKEMFICPLDLSDDGKVVTRRPYEVITDEYHVENRYYYTTRWCLLDNQNKIAIDILSELVYPYVETMSGLYIIATNGVSIAENKRVAIFPMSDYCSDFIIKHKYQEILTKLQKNAIYINGNDYYSNEEYLLNTPSDDIKSRDEVYDKCLVRQFENEQGNRLRLINKKRLQKNKKRLFNF